MQRISQLLLIFWLGCYGSPSHLFGQASASVADSNCVDLVYLKDGSIFRGRIEKYEPGKEIILQSVNGLRLVFDANILRKIKQKCSDPKSPGKSKGPVTRLLPREYSFKERGLYNATRFGALIGQSSWGQNVRGFFAQHSAGWMFRRWLGVGIGAGFENFSPDEGDVATYPIFAELRGYFCQKNLSPYFALAGGYGFAGKIRDVESGNTWGRSIEGWEGGPMAQARLGYRLGNHFTLDFGVRFQRKTRLWSAIWNPGEFGEDKILNKRLELALGIIF